MFAVGALPTAVVVPAVAVFAGVSVEAAAPALLVAVSVASPACRPRCAPVYRLRLKCTFFFGPGAV